MIQPQIAQVTAPHLLETTTKSCSPFPLFLFRYNTGHKRAKTSLEKRILVQMLSHRLFYTLTNLCNIDIRYCPSDLAWSPWDLALNYSLRSHEMSIRNHIWDQLPQCHPFSGLQEHPSFSHAAQQSWSNEKRSPTMDQISGRRDLVCTLQKSIQLQLE